MVVFRKMSGRREGCCDPGSPIPTDDPGLVLNKVKVVTAPAQPAFPGREQMYRHVRAMSRTVRMDKKLGGPSGTWRLSHCTPLQG